MSNVIATHQDLKDKDLVVDGFPINRTITDARQLFSDIEDTVSFFALSNIERFGLTDKPISTMNINSAFSITFIHCHLSVVQSADLSLYRKVELVSNFSCNQTVNEIFSNFNSRKDLFKS